MKAQDLTISIPYKGCNKNCPYCVSKMTGRYTANPELMDRNVDKVLNLANACQVTSVLLTGKGEPLLDLDGALFFTKKFSQFPVEIQTNGIILAGQDGKYPMGSLYKAGMNTIAVSIDDTSELDYKNLFEKVHQHKMIGRACFNITNKFRVLDFVDFMALCKGWNVDQMTLRRIDVPNHTPETEQTRWIRGNADPKIYDRLKEQMKKACENDGFLVRVLPYGTKVYDYQEVSVSYSDYCIQDRNNAEDIRSLIFQEDGHLYSSWNSKASILF